MLNMFNMLKDVCINQETKGVFFQFEIIINVLVNTFRFISIPINGHYKYFTLSVLGLTYSDVHRRQILTSKIGPVLKSDWLIRQWDGFFPNPKEVGGDCFWRHEVTNAWMVLVIIMYIQLLLLSKFSNMSTPVNTQVSQTLLGCRDPITNSG